MRTLIAPCLTILIAALYLGCADDTGVYRSAITGEECVPNATLMLQGERARRTDRGNVSPTGIAGDNLDDLRSGHRDCLGDGDSGHGNDRKHKCECQFPQPGCDDQGCCDTEPDPDEPDDDQPDDDQDLPPIP